MTSSWAQVQQLDGSGGAHHPVVGGDRGIGEQVVRQQGQGGADQAARGVRPFVCECGQFRPAFRPDGSENVTDTVQVRVQMGEGSRIYFAWHAGTPDWFASVIQNTADQWQFDTTSTRKMLGSNKIDADSATAVRARAHIGMLCHRIERGGPRHWMARATLRRSGEPPPFVGTRCARSMPPLRRSTDFSGSCSGGQAA